MNTTDHPAHYNAAKTLDPDGTAKYEAIKVIRNWQLGFGLGNAVKYILRAPHKGNELEDLRKALWYLDEARQYEWLCIQNSPDYFTAAEVAGDWGLSLRVAEVLQSIFYRKLSEAHERLQSYIRTKS